MSTIVIKIHTDNAAFEDGGGSEVARILRQLADQFDSDGFYAFTVIRDINGNKVGTTDLIDGE